MLELTYIKIEIKAWVGNYIHINLKAVIIHQCHKFKSREFNFVPQKTMAAIPYPSHNFY